MRRDYTAEEIANMDKDDVWHLPKGGLRITFTNGETVKSKTNSVIVSWYYWQLIKENPGGGYAKHMLVPSRNFSGGIHYKVGAAVYWHAFFSGTDNDHMEVWRLALRYYELFNELYNDVCIRMGTHLGTISLVDVMGIVCHEDVEAAQELYRTGKATIEETHAVVMATCRNHEDPAMKVNNMAVSIRASILDTRATTQAIGPRGYISDIDGEGFPYPIDVGYIEGLHKAYQSLIESKTASVALYMANAPLKTSEYNNRICQLLCSAIRGVAYREHRDCGTTRTIPWLVTKENLNDLKGKNYVVDTVIRQISGKEVDLIGTTIHIRSMTLCENPDPGITCQTCLGFTSWIIPPRASPGHILSITPLGKISQTLLSAKHVINSTNALTLSMTGQGALMLTKDQDNPFEIRINNPPKGQYFKLGITTDDALFMTDVETGDLATMSTDTITDMNTVNLMVFDEQSDRHITTVALNLQVGGKGSPLSREMLYHVHGTGWDVHTNEYVINLKEWDFRNPFIKTRRRGEDVMATLKSFQTFINGNEPYGSVTAFKEPGPAIAELYDRLSVKLSVNFVHAEIFVRALMCREGGYGLPVGGEPFEFRGLRDILQRRSTTTMFAYQGQADRLEDPTMFTNQEPLTPVPLDGMFYRPPSTVK